MHRILSLRDLGQRAAVADVDLVRPGAVAGGLLQEGGVAVGEGDVVGAAAMEQVDDGAADLAGAEDQDFSGHSRCPLCRRSRAARSDNSLRW